ncbi:MAG: hypothetical protein DRI54_05055 [Bacteroidetes bacterium]|nr:MAG: hypothetical protein DRI54_05055 [Bacteroidota bacterium]
MHNKTFRLFISSTFSDFTGEREVLQIDVFPELEAYCAAHGYQFQAIDLRWGVNEEAQLDQKTIEICLNEVITCKHYPHPNFLIMLGNRYGWVPLPYAIEKIEFENILDYYSGKKEQQKLLREWYQHDKNHLKPNNSTAYIIKPRSEKFVDFAEWEKVENQLRKLFQNAVSEKESIIGKQKYLISATEHEVIEGIYPYRKYADINSGSENKSNSEYQLDMEYVYGFIRQINPGIHKPIHSIYFDSSNKRLLQFKSNLEKTLVKKNLLELQTDMISTNSIEQNYLVTFRERILHYLKSSVEQQIIRIADGSAVEKIKSEHLAFKQERLKIFVGRSELLEKIEKYVDGSSSGPLVIHANSGMGKTSLIAKAIDNESQRNKNKLIYRFVGATERSTNIRSLLISIIWEINPESAEELNKIFDDDRFNDLVKKILSEIKKPTIIFIDALDQLQEKSYLNWLPDILPNHLKLIISVLEDEHYKDDSGYLDQLKVKFKSSQGHNNFIQLKTLKREEGDEILSKLLFQIDRTVTKEQRKYVLDKFENSGCSPLYLIIAFEEIKKWKSFDSTFDKILKDDVISIINRFINDLSSVYHHQPLLVSRTMGYLECAKNGLSEKEMLDVLSSDDEVMDVIENQFHKNLSNKLPVAPWARLYSQLAPFVIEKLSDNVSLIALFHRQFKNAILTEILSDTGLKKKLHQNLAKYFNSKSLISTEGVYNLRKLSEQAFQLYNSEQTDELLNYIEKDYINIKYKTDQFYNCLYEIEQAFILITQTEKDESDYKERLFSALLNFLNSYSLEHGKIFDFEMIHTYFVYRRKSKFYPEFLERTANKEYVGKHFSDDNFVDEYYLLFLSGFVGYLRRNAKLKEAAIHVNRIIKEYRTKLDTTKDNTTIQKQLSSSYYELGYILYLTGNFKEANSAFVHSVDFAQKINNEISEWITKCVMTRIAYFGGLITIDEFDATLDKAYDVFKRLESTNHVAKRWLMVTQHHKFEVANFKSDLKQMRKYFDFLRTNQWNKEYDVAMELYNSQIALAENKFDLAVNFLNKYLNKFPKETVLKEEAIAEVFYYLGLAYFKEGDIEKAKYNWNKAMSLNDEPGNHTFKRKTQEKLELV